MPEPTVINLDADLSVYDYGPDNWWHSLCPEDCKSNIEYGPKFKVMLDIINECQKVGDKLLIFSNSLFELDGIESFLQQNSTESSEWVPKYDYYRMDGQVPSHARVQLCNSFNDKMNKRTRLFLVSQQVGALGLNLVAANRVILMDVNWNPAFELQSIFRIYRFGQTKECFIYRLLSMDSMENVVYRRNVNKLAMAGRVVDLKQISRHYTSNDIQQLYSFNYNPNEERRISSVPVDSVLRNVLQNCMWIKKYHEHHVLLQNKPEEELDEAERKLAWDEYNKEEENRLRNSELQKQRLLAMQQGPSGVNPLQFKTPMYSKPPVIPSLPELQVSLEPSAISRPIRYGTAEKTVKSTAASDNPHNFEIVLLPDNGAEKTTNNAQVNNVQQELNAKPDTELRKQFMEYLPNFQLLNKQTLQGPKTYGVSSKKQPEIATNNPLQLNSQQQSSINVRTVKSSNNNVRTVKSSNNNVRKAIAPNQAILNSSIVKKIVKKMQLTNGENTTNANSPKVVNVSDEIGSTIVLKDFEEMQLSNCKKQRQLIESLTNNLNITLSVCEKSPVSANMKTNQIQQKSHGGVSEILPLDLSKAAVSISTVPRKKPKRQKIDDVIEID